MHNLAPQDTTFEFRDYTLRPGRRDTLIDLFEHAFIEPLEAAGAHVRATFRDLDNPDRFVWIRSFADARARFEALDAFYTGEVWRWHRNAANDTMIDSDNVLQLKPMFGDLGDLSRAPLGATARHRSMIVATLYQLTPGASGGGFASFFTDEIAPLLRDIQAFPFAAFITDPSPNAYPRLPVREGETVFLTLARFETVKAYAPASPINAEIAQRIGAAAHLVARTETRRLQPTARSALR